MSQTALQNETPSLEGIRKGRWRAWVMLAALLVLALSVRLYGLGSRSLWADEFCTWHVSRMPLGESLRWGPELTKPPLYQLTLRTITSDPHPPESVLRSPACAAGVLTIIAVFALARVAGGVMTGLAAAGLLACNLMHIHYSQEARPYSMLVLGSTVSMLLWYGLVRKPTWVALWAYVFTTALTFYTHYLTGLSVVAQIAWWLAGTIHGTSSTSDERMVQGLRPDDRSLPPSGPLDARNVGRKPQTRGKFLPLIAVGATAALCAPIVFHYLHMRSSIFQGLSWIKPPTWNSALEVLEQITFGPIWVVALLAPALVLWVVASTRWTRGRHSVTLRTRRIAGHFEHAQAGEVSRFFEKPKLTSWDHRNLCGLLVAWLFCSWFGLLVISWVAHPAMVDRYALPAAIPALLIPLIVAHHFDRRLPIVIMVVFSALGLRDWTKTRWEVEPGFRELSHYLAETVDPWEDAVVLTIDRRTHPDWVDAERLPFQYYPVNDDPIEELHLAPDGVTATNDALRDPRRLYLVVLWAEPFAILRMAGRETELFSIEGQTYTQLLFSPYRLVRVAPLQ